MRRVSHAHIVQVYELGREGDLDFIFGVQA